MNDSYDSTIISEVILLLKENNSNKLAATFLDCRKYY